MWVAALTSLQVTGLETSLDDKPEPHINDSWVPHWVFEHRVELRGCGAPGKTHRSFLGPLISEQGGEGTFSVSYPALQRKILPRALQPLGHLCLYRGGGWRLKKTKRQILGYRGTGKSWPLADWLSYLCSFSWRAEAQGWGSTSFTEQQL